MTLRLSCSVSPVIRAVVEISSSKAKCEYPKNPQKGNQTNTDVWKIDEI